MATETGRNGELDQAYEALFDPPLDAKYTCPICLSALKNPVQTKCGHRFCRSCLKRSAGGARYSRCPVDKTLLDVIKGVFEDVAMKREVMSLSVKCRFYTDECAWKGELRNLKNHESLCPNALIPCQNNCMQEIRRRDLEVHGYECPYRLEPCTHCHKHIILNDMTKHQLLVCPRFPVTCSVCQASAILRENIAKHVDTTEGDCPEVIVKCSFNHLGCYFQDKRKDMSTHYDVSCQSHLLLMSTRLAQQGDMIQEQGVQLQRLVTTCVQLTQLITSQHSELSDYQEQLLTHSIMLNDVQQTGCNGQLLWKINLPEDNNCQIQSPYFYTGRPGYRLSLTLELAGFRDYNEIYSSVFVNLKKGHYDNELRFPFEGTCHITIKDQSEGAAGNHMHFSTRIVCSRVPRCTTEEGRGGNSTRHQRGRLKLMRTNELLGGRYVRQGCLLLQVEATHFPNNPDL